MLARQQRRGSTVRSRQSVSAGRRRGTAAATEPAVVPSIAAAPALLADAVSVALVAVAVEAVETDAAVAAQQVFRLRGEGLPARRAASCLVTPQVGDVVLVAVRADEPPLVIAVLTRAVNGTANLSVPAAEGLEVVAPKIAIEAQEGWFRIANAQFLGDTALLVCNTVETLCTTLQSYAQRLITKAGFALRVVDEIDSTVASTVLVQAKQTCSLQAMQTLISSTHDTRLDGERISMG